MNFVCPCSVNQLFFTHCFSYNLPFHNLTQTFILPLIYFFCNVRPKKLSWQYKVFISLEAIRVLAVPFAAAKTTAPKQCLLFPTLLSTTTSCSPHQHKVKRGAVPAVNKTLKHFAVRWITCSGIWCCVVWYCPTFRRIFCALSSGYILCLKSASA